MTNDEGLGLNDAFVAWGKAGMDLEFTLFKLYTRPLRDPKTGETGQFDTACKMPLTDFEQHRDPLSLLKYLVRKYLLEAVKDTGVPYEKWIVEFSPIMERYQIPSHLFLDTGRDRAWLV